MVGVYIHSETTFVYFFFQFLTVLQEVSQQLSQAVLTNIVERAEAVDVPQWLEHLSQLSNTLPGLRC